MGQSVYEELLRILKNCSAIGQYFDTADLIFTAFVNGAGFNPNIDNFSGVRAGFFQAKNSLTPGPVQQRFIRIEVAPQEADQCGDYPFEIINRNDHAALYQFQFAYVVVGKTR